MSVLASLLGRQFWISAYLALAAGLYLPVDLGFLRHSIPLWLAVILYCTALRVTLDALADEAKGAKRSLRLGALCVYKLLLLPGLTWWALSSVAPSWALGITFVALMPAGLTSPALAGIYGGNVALALLLVVVTTSLTPLSAPTLLAFFDPEAAQAAGGWLDQAGFILALIAVPTLLAQLTRRIAPGWVERHQAHFGPTAVFSLCGLIFSAAAVSRLAWEAQPAGGSLAAGLGWCVLACGAWALLSLLSLRLLGPRDALAVATTTIYVNHGFAMAFTTRFFPDDPTMLLPPVLIQVPMVAAVAGVGYLCSRSQ